MKKYCYSTNEEEFTGGFDSIDEAIEEARDVEDSDVVYIGEVVHASEFLKGKCSTFADDVVERSDEYLFEFVGGDDEIITMDKQEREAFGQVIFDFLVENASFTRWGVKNVQRFDINQEQPNDNQR
jgi:hypothetical protein